MSFNNTQEPPPAKKQKLLGASDRITLDVGGTKFVSAASTLSANSTYFASLLSSNWSDGDEIFLDQDPVAFGKLLAYMRRGNIKVDDIDTDVLALAEFLGAERLLLAVKVRWYCNIGKGPVLSEDEEIAAAFDQEHGGILKAISAGLFSCFLKHDNVNAEKDYATLSYSDSGTQYMDNTPVIVTELLNGEQGQSIGCSGLIGALNGIYAKGYTLDSDEIDHSCEVVDWSMRFSRMRHTVIRSSATDIFIPTDTEIKKQEGSSHVKQFALHVNDRSGYGEEQISAPAEFNDDSNQKPYAEATITAGAGIWLEMNNFVTREKELEENVLVNEFFKSLLYGDGAKTGGLYSRLISRA